MSTKASQPDNFDSTAKLMIEALAKASAELEKSVTAFTEQLISFNEGIQKSLEAELKAIDVRLDGCIKGNLDDLNHNRHVLMKRLMEVERTEIDALTDAGRQVRAALAGKANQIEQKLEAFIDKQIKELKDFLQQPQKQMDGSAAQVKSELQKADSENGAAGTRRQQKLRQQLSDKVNELEKQIKAESEKTRETIKTLSNKWSDTLRTQNEGFERGITQIATDTLTQLDEADVTGNQSLAQTEQHDRALLEQTAEQWRQQVDANVDSFNKLIASLAGVLKENFDTKLANASDQAKQEIATLVGQAHERIAATRSELEIELRGLEKEYIHQLENTLRKLEAMISEHANDKRNSGVARQHRAQKLRDQMHVHLKRWGASLVDSIKDASTQLENEFNHATDGYHVRIEGARASAVELLERESKLMQKDLDRVLKEFQREVADQESQISKIESAGQDAVVTVIACRKAMLSFKGE